MDDCILDIRNKCGHLTPKKSQYSPYKHRPIDYGSKQYMVQPAYNSPSLDDKGIKKVQFIIGALLYVGRAEKSL